MGQDGQSQKEAWLTNCCHETIYWSMLVMSLTHWYQYHQVLLLRIWFIQLTCGSLSRLLAIWSMTNFVLMWRHWNIAYPLTSFCNYLSFHMKATYLPVHLLPFQFSYANVQFDPEKMHYPEMWKFWKNYEWDIIPCPKFMFQNMSEQSQW